MGSEGSPTLFTEMQNRHAEMFCVAAYILELVDGGTRGDCKVAWQLGEEPRMLSNLSHRNAFQRIHHEHLGDEIASTGGQVRREMVRARLQKVKMHKIRDAQNS